MRESDKPDKTWFKLSDVTVEPLAFFFTFGLFLSFPTTAALIYKKSCLIDFNETFCDDMDNKTFKEDHKDEEDVIQETASFWTMLNQVALVAPSTFNVFLFMASWGDKVDRKIPILLPCIGAMFCNLVNILSSHYLHSHIGILLIGTILNSILGTYTTLLMGIYTYIVHISTPQQKTIRVGIVESMSYMAGGISVFVSGHLRREVGFTGVFAITLGFIGFSTLYCIFCIKSVRPVAAANEQSEKGCLSRWCLGAIQNMIAFLRKKREGNTTQYIWLYIILINLMQLGTAGEIDLLFIFLKRAPRSFNAVQYGYFKGSENFCRGISLVILLPVLKGVFKWRDTSIVIAGVVFKGVQFCILGLAQTLEVVFIALIFATLQGFPAAALRSGMSRLVEKDENGRLFGIVAMTEGIISLSASFLFNGLYTLTLDVFDGIMFECVTGLSFIAFLITMYLRVRGADIVVTDEKKDNVEDIYVINSTKL